MGFFSLSTFSGSDETRDEAIKLGITVEEVNRSVPQFQTIMRSFRFVESFRLVETSVVKYSIARRGSKNSWMLLQRLQSHGANMPNDYLLESTGVLPKALRQAITEIAETYDEEFFEFSSDDSEVAVYWEEWGGRKKAVELHVLLSKLASL